MYILDADKLIEIFCKTDDFYLQFDQWLSGAEGSRLGLSPGSVRQPGLYPSEIMTILIFYHLSGFKCFKYYYERFIRGFGRDYFPKAPTYNRFIELIPRACLPLLAFIKTCCLGKKTGIYYIDATPLAVCRNQRIHNHRVFEGIAKRGKTSMGWFFGLKLHLVINDHGELIALKITSGNVADNNHEVLRELLKGLKGKCFGDRGYLSSLFEEFYENGLRIFSKIKRNMKEQLLEHQDKKLLNKRTIIESAIDICKHVCNIEHSRHRSPDNALTHLLAGVTAYTFLDDKPSIYNSRFQPKNQYKIAA